MEDRSTNVFDGLNPMMSLLCILTMDMKDDTG